MAGAAGGVSRSGGPLRIGVLALQGDFELHVRSLQRCGALGSKVRLGPDLDGLHGLIIPGGESTTMVRLLRVYGLFDTLRKAGEAGLPMFGTCAGAIVLGRGDAYPERLGVAPVQVRRNAYGRQRESFEKPLQLSLGGDPFTCIFIRAPKIDPAVGLGVEVLGRDGEDPILVRCGKILLATFHPELTEDLRVHELFLQLCHPVQAGH